MALDASVWFGASGFALCDAVVSVQSLKLNNIGTGQ